MPSSVAQSPGNESARSRCELELRAQARSWPELVASAGRALGAWFLRLAAASPVPVWRRVDVQASDRAGLLVNWLNELLYRIEAEWWVPVEFAVEAASDHEIRARVRGVSVAQPPALFTAAGLRGVTVVDVPGGLEATVRLDLWVPEGGGRHAAVGAGHP